MATPDTHPVLTTNNGATLSQDLLLERARLALSQMHDCVEINQQKRGGVPVLKGTRFTIAQLFAEIAEGRSIEAIADDFDLDLEMMKALLQGFAVEFVVQSWVDKNWEMSHAKD